MPMPTPRDYSTADTMRPEQKVGKPEEGSDSLDSFIRQAIGREPFLSFPRAGDSPVQWIQLLHALDQQGTAKLSKGPKFNDNIEGKERHLGHCNGVSMYTSESNGVKESIHPIKSSGIAVKGTKSASENMQTLKIPEAVVAFAQAAAKANDLPGWPLLSPSKVPMQKCDKCSREFCSPINYRRHIRVHRRSLNIDKDSPKNRDILGAFWDKLSLDESKELVSFKNVTLEEVPGSSIIRALTSFIWKPVFSSLPQAYVKAGSALLDIIQARPSKFPLSSQELFSILDDASENTFLCAGTADSMQKFVFDGEAGKIGLEMKNLVACTSFLVEQKLVKAWIADKDAEALRCQKLLVEEEEAAQKRQAEILEKRRLKKLRQKEQKSKEQTSVEKTDFKESSPETWEDLPSAETTSPVDVFDSHPCTSGEQLDPIQPSLEPNQLLDTDLEADTGSHAGFSDPDVEMASGNTSSANYQNVYHEVQQESSRRQMNAARRQLPKQLKGTSNGFHSGQIPPMSKVGAAPKHGSYRDQRATSTVNGHKVWTRKTKCENEEECSNVKEQREFLNQSDQNGSNELLIGSISVTLGDCSGGCQGNILAASVDQCTSDYQPPRRNNTQEKPIKLDVCHSSTSRSMIKLWRPVGRQEGSMAVQNETREAEMDVNSGEGTDRILSNESCLVQGNIDDNSSESRNGSSKLWEESTDARGLRLFSSRAAAAFLAQRWKEAIAADHVKLVLFPKTGPPGSPEILDDAEVATALPSDCCKVNNLGNAGVGPLEVSPTGPNKAKFRGKPEKVIKLKYIPKQRNGT